MTSFVRLAALTCLSLFLGMVCADVYLHNMRGSNDRLNEANNNRDNGNRLFDSQNNNRGGYNVGDDFAKAGAKPSGGGVMKFYSGSKLYIEWTNQHGCGVDHPKSRCELVLQYMCDDTATDNGIWNKGTTTGIRDGTTTTTIPENDANDSKFGRHEPVDWYQQCKDRDRNKGLFTADQNVQDNIGATSTRQNPNGDRHGFECPEERDYYPYWHPTPWKDIAILTWNTSMCDYYKAESGNVKEKGYCSDAQYNNAVNCSANGGSWKTYSHGIAAPECIAAPWSRDNHNGNGLSTAQPGGFVPEANRYLWTMPSVGNNLNCVFRLRYNISTADYWGYDYQSINASFNDDKSPVQNDPTVDIGIHKGLRLAINTAQFGRTFQDRSHMFTMLPASGGGTIWNLNIRGRRGNIVDVYPAVEYDFVPNNLTINSEDRVHIQWTGSTTTPDGTDKNNMVEVAAINLNYPLTFDKLTMWKDGVDQAVKFASCGATAAFDEKLDDRSCYFDGGLVTFNKGTYYYLCTVNNDFSNRSQKGTLVVK